MLLFEDETLESMCLDVIINNFDLFLTAFNSDENFRIYVPVIQKRWVDKILKVLYERKAMKNEYLHFVLSKYLTELDLKTVCWCNLELLFSHLAEIGHVIEKVSLSFIYDLQFEHIWRYFSNVHTVDLQNTSCSNQALFIMASNCPHIKNLNLHGSNEVDDAGLLSLAEKLCLESLNLQETNVTILGIAHILREIPSLKYLWYDRVPEAILKALELNHLSGRNTVFNLKNLLIKVSNDNMNAYHLTSLLEICQSTCPYINDLLVNQIFSEEELALCALFPQLRRVNLHFLPHGVNVDNFLRLAGIQIHVMSLKFASLSLEVLLYSCPNLENLSLNCPHFEHSPFTAKLNFPHLKYLSICNDCAFPLENAQPLATLISLCPNLEELKMERCKLSSEIIDAILNHPKQFKKLYFDLMSVKIPFLEEILKLYKDLKVLHLRNCGLTADEYNEIKNTAAKMKHKVSIIWHNDKSFMLTYLIRAHAAYEKFFRDYIICGLSCISYSKLKLLLVKQMLPFRREAEENSSLVRTQVISHLRVRSSCTPIQT